MRTTHVNGTAASGPLVVSAGKPRYFVVASGEDAGRTVFLAGSHIHNNYHDGIGAGPDFSDESEPVDFDGCLDFLQERGQNLIRRWRWKHIRSQTADGNFHLCMAHSHGRARARATRRTASPSPAA